MYHEAGKIQTPSDISFGPRYYLQPLPSQCGNGNTGYIPRFIAADAQTKEIKMFYGNFIFFPGYDEKFPHKAFNNASCESISHLCDWVAHGDFGYGEAHSRALTHIGEGHIIITDELLSLQLKAGKETAEHLAVRDDPVPERINFAPGLQCYVYGQGYGVTDDIVWLGVGSWKPACMYRKDGTKNSPLHNEYAVKIKEKWRIFTDREENETHWSEKDQCWYLDF